MHLVGIHTALVTPFAPDGSLDQRTLVRLIEDQLSSGIQGFVVAGGTGEGLALTEREIHRVLAITLEAAAGRVPVTAHVSALSTAAAVQNTERALIAGAQIAMLQAPFDVPLTDDELVGHFEAVAAVGLPVMVYNNVSTGIALSTDLIARLARVENVAYLKDSSSDASRMTEIRSKTDGRLEILLGKDSFTLFGFLSGARAAVLGSANAIPRACVLLHHLAVVQDDVVGARELWRVIAPLLGFFESESYVAAVKAATELLGIPVGVPRLPMLPLSDEKRLELKRLYTPVIDAVSAPAATDR